MAARLTGSNLGVFPEALYIQFSAVGLMVICCGMLEMSVRKMKAQTVKVETVALSAKNGQNVTCCVLNV